MRGIITGVVTILFSFATLILFGGAALSLTTDLVAPSAQVALAFIPLSVMVATVFPMSVLLVRSR